MPIAIVRKVARSLPATTKTTFIRDVLRPAGVPYRENKSEGWIEFPNGSRITFFGLDPDPETGMPSKVGSFDAGFIFVDEAVELAEADWVMLQGRLRSTVAPYRQIAAATNPSHPEHWLKKRFDAPHPHRLYLHASSFDNRLLPQDYLEQQGELTGLYRMRYAEGLWVAVEGVLWKQGMFGYRDAPLHRVNGEYVPDYVRIVVAVDPAVTHGPDSDETGIIVAARGADGRGYVLDDLSGTYSPGQWGRRAGLEAYDEWKADAVVGEVNNGGDLIESNLRNCGFRGRYRKVTASKGKRKRAEPVVALYEQGLISHVRTFPQLEAQMFSFDPENMKSSPDRCDALVWALTELFETQTSGRPESFSVAA